MGGLANIDSPTVYSGAVQSYASFSFNIGHQRLNSPTHPITWFNKSNKPVLTLNMLSDSGADYSTIDSKHAGTLGIVLNKGTPATVQGTGGQVENTFYIHQIPFRIGTLTPRMGLVAMGRGAGTDVFGRTQGLNHYNVVYTKEKVLYTELASANLAMTPRWRKY